MVELPRAVLKTKETIETHVATISRTKLVEAEKECDIYGSFFK
jgi:hypothetical protein